MTLDEVIKHEEEVADSHHRIMKVRAITEYDLISANYHRQLAEWLKELKQLREQTRYIPCSERLPEEDGFYLATCNGEICGESEPFSGLAEFLNGKWVDDEEDYQCVIAWMPLPEPYKAEAEREKKI